MSKDHDHKCCTPPSDADKITTAINDLTGELVEFRRLFLRHFHHLIELIAMSHHDTGRRGGFEITFGPPRLKRTSTMEERTITNEQEIDLTLTPKTDSGKEVKVDGKPTVSVVTGDSTFTQSDDGMKITFRSSDTPGDTDFLIEADADLGGGVQTISTTVRLHVEGARATNLGLSFGEPRAKSPTPVA